MFITFEHCALSDPFWSTSRRALPSLQLTTVSLAPVGPSWSCCGGARPGRGCEPRWPGGSCSCWEDAGPGCVSLSWLLSVTV